MPLKNNRHLLQCALNMSASTFIHYVKKANSHLPSLIGSMVLLPPPLSSVPTCTPIFPRDASNETLPSSALSLAHHVWQLRALHAALEAGLPEKKSCGWHGQCVSRTERKIEEPCGKGSVARMYRRMTALQQI